MFRGNAGCNPRILRSAASRSRTLAREVINAAWKLVSDAVGLRDVGEIPQSRSRGSPSREFRDSSPCRTCCLSRPEIGSRKDERPIRLDHAADVFLNGVLHLKERTLRIELRDFDGGQVGRQPAASEERL